jgi:hypothetical protein
MSDLITNLRSLNRKERFHLIGWALGNPGFTLSPEFCKAIGDQAGVAVPGKAFCAMDFHVDWINAALHMARDKRERYAVSRTRPVNLNQEDVDLLIAFDRGRTTHLVMVEAKGATGWTNAQLEHKVGRLSVIFGKDGRKWMPAGVEPHWVLTSPKESAGIKTTTWPKWAKRADGRPRWVPLPYPHDLRKIVRCDPRGTPAEDGRYWKVVDAP